VARRATGSGAGPSRWTGGQWVILAVCGVAGDGTRTHDVTYHFTSRTLKKKVGYSRQNSSKIAAKNYSTTRSHLVSHGITECGSRMVKYR
jgi:hypothetical protein